MSAVADVIVVGGGIAGIVTALELLEHGHSVWVVERNGPDTFGGLAAWAFGGIFVVDSPLQRQLGMRDSPELAFADWCATADFGPDDGLARQWAERYVRACRDEVFAWLRRQSIEFLSPVAWVERGLYGPGNSYPRFHMVSGTGRRLVEVLTRNLREHPNAARLKLLFRHRVTDFTMADGRVNGCVVVNEERKTQAELLCGTVVVASGGVTGNLERVRANWYKPWGKAPEVLLNGSHVSADGNMHDVVQKRGGQVGHLDRMWNYPAGVHHPSPRHPFHGLSLIPPKNALWVNYEGRRIGSPPLVTGYDTRYLVEQIARQRHQYSWQILNYRTAVRELGLSGSEYNDRLTNPTWLGLLCLRLFGNRSLVDFLVKNCKDFVTANSLEALVERMNTLQAEPRVNLEILRQEVNAFDRNMLDGREFFNDDQLRRILHLREYSGDRSRTRTPSKILDPGDYPLIAIREFIVTRKTLGGIRTDLKSRVLTPGGVPIPGLYAVGESAGFGGGGAHGLRALEGTFLGGCIFTARIAAQAINEGF